MTNDRERLEAWRREAAVTEGVLLLEGSAERAGEGRAMLFRRPVEVLEARRTDEVEPMLRRLDEAVRGGRYVAGQLSYEAGLGWHGMEAGEGRLGWFGVYDAPEVMEIAPDEAASGEQEPLGPVCLEMETSRADYDEQVRRIEQYIAAGDTYQVNLTTAVGGSYRGETVRLYEALLRQQSAGYSALLHLPGGEVVQSFSPELFFRVDADRRIVTRPMKGTAPPGIADGEDFLRNDPKNRAEHVMIVDLLRNDLGRICEAGSVTVDALFAVERYRTLLQMTSTVSGRLREGTGLPEIFPALFPSGSMTGAPKRRTMEIIDELEGRPRGVYSGTIGFAAPDGTAVWSVAIRTLVLRDGQLRMGVGGGIVADSRAEQERAECWLKADFVQRATEPYKLIETMRWDGRYRWLGEHMARLRRTAEELGFPFDRERVVADLTNYATKLEGDRRVRVLLARDGRLELSSSALRHWTGPLRVRLSSKRTWSGDRFLLHKTTVRGTYDTEQRRALDDRWDEALFANERDEVTEGSIMSLLVQMGGRWWTPSLTSGVLPGVSRGILLRSGDVTERVITLAELQRAEAVAMVNGVRGVHAVRLIDFGAAGGGEVTYRTDLAIPRMPEEEPALGD